MTLDERIDLPECADTTTAVLDAEPSTGNYDPKPEEHTLFCEQYLEKPALPEDEFRRTLASYGWSTYLIPGTNDEDDD